MYINDSYFSLWVASIQKPKYAQRVEKSYQKGQAKKGKRADSVIAETSGSQQNRARKQ